MVSSTRTHVPVVIEDASEDVHGGGDDDGDVLLLDLYLFHPQVV